MFFVLEVTSRQEQVLSKCTPKPATHKGAMCGFRDTVFRLLHWWGMLIGRHMLSCAERQDGLCQDAAVGQKRMDMGMGAGMQLVAAQLCQWCRW